LEGGDARSEYDKGWGSIDPAPRRAIADGLLPNRPTEAEIQILERPPPRSITLHTSCLILDCDKEVAKFVIGRLPMSQQDLEAQNLPHAQTLAEPIAPNSAVDSGVDAGSSSEYDQENSSNYFLQAQDDTSEASTDEG
jgi:hypothetical protein